MKETGVIHGSWMKYKLEQPEVRKQNQEKHQRSFIIQECLESSHKPLGLGNLMGIFVYLAIGFLITIIILILELFLRSVRNINIIFMYYIIKEFEETAVRQEGSIFN